MVLRIRAQHLVGVFDSWDEVEVLQMLGEPFLGFNLEIDPDIDLWICIWSLE